MYIAVSEHEHQDRVPESGGLEREPGAAATPA